MGTFLSSGFEAASTTRSASQPLAQPSIRKIKHGNTGQLLLSVTRVQGVSSYEVRSAPFAAAAVTAGPTSGSWMTTGFTSTKSAVPINNLTPGTTYIFQVRALDPLGYTDWSDGITRMCA
jgi:hypothetical protein